MPNASEVQPSFSAHYVGFEGSVFCDGGVGSHDVCACVAGELHRIPSAFNAVDVRSFEIEPS